MPLIPRGLTEGLVERLKERVKRELEQRVVSPIKERVRQELGIEEPVPDPEHQPHRRPVSIAEKMFRIQDAGRQRVMLYMEYNGIYRYVEPYSYRYRDKDNPNQPLLFAYCHKDHGIEAFKLVKITDAVVTRRTFSPRWDVEFN